MPLKVAPPAPASGPDIEMPGRRTDLRRVYNMAPPAPVSGPTIEVPRREEPKPPQPAPDDEDEEDEKEGDEPKPEPQPAQRRMRNAQELIAAAQGATSKAELDEIEQEAQGRTSVLSAVSERRRQI